LRCNGRAKEKLDGNRFNSAAYNARVSAEEEAAAKDKYEKSDANGKQDALEVCELAQELAAQRKASLAAAEQALRGNELIVPSGAIPEEVVSLGPADVVCRAELGGLLNHYERRAA